VTRKAQLNEVNLGLWQGLLLADLKRKHRRAFLTWMENPDSVEPPGGERLDRAYARLVAGLEDIIRANMRRKVMVVLGPYAYALLTCYLRDRELDRFWDIFGEAKMWEIFAV
jgi:broad specificity phosphatase PhoE